MVNSSTNIKSLKRRRKNRTYADGTLGPDFGQTQTCGSVKPVY